MADEELKQIEFEAQRCRELLADERYAVLRKFVTDTILNFDADIHLGIMKGGDIEKLRVLEEVKRFLGEFIESPYSAVDRLREAKEEAEIQRLKAEIEQ